MAGDEAGELPGCVRDLIGLSGEDEQALLYEIFTAGWGQGCLLAGADLRPPALTPHAIERLLEQVSGRASVHPSEGGADPFERKPVPQLLPDEDSGLVILSQRCDIVKPLCTEPLVEVALARRSTDPELVAAARNGNSACYLHLADCEEDEGAWLVDLRTRAHLPKHWLEGRAPAQLLPAGRARRRFAARLGERNSRIPVPTEIVDGFQGKLRGWLYSSATRRAQCAHFSDFLLLPAEDEAWAVIVLLGEGKDADQAIKDFDILLAAIVDRVDPFPISSDYSGVLRPEELAHADYLAAHKLDFKRVTYGSKSSGTSQAEPALEQG